MTNRIIAFIFLFLCLSTYAQESAALDITESYSLPKTSIRAIETDQHGDLWFAGSNGVIGTIKNGQIVIDTLKMEGKPPQFRSIAIYNETVYILTIESPAFLFKFPKDQFRSIDKQLVYREDHSNAFYNSLKIEDGLGVAMGDPTTGCLSVLINDRSPNWRKLDCSLLPPLIEGEAGFAASNTNVSIRGDRIWIATGGQKARVFYSFDSGKSWDVSDTPLQQGNKMTGIFSMDFYDKDLGIIAGGNWEDKSSKINTLAVTKNGGKNWKSVANEEIPGYISCIQFIEGENGKHIVATSTEGTYYSMNSGESWKQISNDGFYTIRMINDSEAWMATYEKIVKVKINVD